MPFCEVARRIDALTTFFDSVSDQLDLLERRLEVLEMKRRAASLPSGRNAGAKLPRRAAVVEQEEEEPEQEEEHEGEEEEEEQEEAEDEDEVLFPVGVVFALSGEGGHIELGPSATCNDAKAAIMRQWGIPVPQQRILIGGEEELRGAHKVFQEGECGGVVLTVLRVSVLDFQELDRVIAVRDSAYMEWRKAGDEGVVCNLEPSGDLDVLWDRHLTTTPFGPSIPGADPYEVLRIIDRESCAFREGDRVVVTTAGKAHPWHRAGEEGIVQSVSEVGEVIVAWLGGTLSPPRICGQHSECDCSDTDLLPT